MSSVANSHYRVIFEHVSEPIGVIKDGIFVDCNQAMLDLFRLDDKAEIIGRRPGEAFSHDEQPDGTRSREKANAALQRCVAEGQASLNWTSRRPNGDLLTYHIVLRALDDSDRPCIVAHLRDISQLLASKCIDHDRRDYLLELLESSPVAFMVSDLDTGLIRTVNRAGRLMLGLSDQAWWAMRAEDLLATPSDRFRFLAALRKHGEARGEIRLRRMDGTELSSEVHWRFNPGNQTELMCWGTDITEFKRTQQELELSRDQALEANRAKSQFLSRMSHQLRTPMNAILGFGQLLQLDYDRLTKSQNSAVAHILGAGKHLLELIKDVLDFSRVDSGRVPLKMRRISASEALQASTDLVRPLAASAGVSVSVQADSLPDVFADDYWLRQVLVNLLSNAIKYNVQDGTVSVSYEARCEGRLRIHVKDSGEGIQPEDVSRLFIPFEQFPAAGHTSEGAGIGLALCKEIIDMMGGNIGFTSEVGVGSDFWVDLQPVTAHETDAASRAKQPFRILFIDAQAANVRPMVQSASSIAGCELVTTADFTLGAELAGSIRPDLVVMNVDLPPPDVVAKLLDQISNDAETPAPLMLGLTADCEARQSGDGRLAAFSHLLPVPLQAPALIELIEKRLG